MGNSELLRGNEIAGAINAAMVFVEGIYGLIGTKDFHGHGVSARVVTFCFLFLWVFVLV